MKGKILYPNCREHEYTQNRDGTGIDGWDDTCMGELIAYAEAIRFRISEILNHSGIFVFADIYPAVGEIFSAVRFKLCESAPEYDITVCSGEPADWETKTVADVDFLMEGVFYFGDDWFTVIKTSPVGSKCWTNGLEYDDIKFNFVDMDFSFVLHSILKSVQLI